MPQKVWAVGEEALAADFNTYLQQQVVATFATTAARDAWASPPNGALCITTDTMTTWLRVAGAWQLYHSLAAWTPYTPNLAGAGGAIGNGTWKAAYRLEGKTLLLRAQFIWGSTTTFSGGPWSISLPSGLTTPAAVEQFMSARAYRSSASTYFHGPAEIAGGGSVVIPRVGDANQIQSGIGGTSPFTWAVNDTLAVYGPIEVA